MRTITFRSAHSLAAFLQALAPRVEFDVTEEPGGCFVLRLV